MSIRKVKFIVGKTSTGFDAYHEDGESIIATTGDNIGHLKSNIIEAYNLFADHKKKKLITEAQISLEFDIASFFQFYPEITAAGIGRRIGMQKSLISEYVNGKKRPSEKQVRKILAGIKSLGKELSEIELA